MTLQDLEQIAASGESETVEFKKPTAQLPRVGETLCAFLNGQGGRVLIGVTKEGRILGQQISDGTLREIAAALARFEPPALVSQERIPLSDDREVLMLSVPAAADTGPYTYDGRPYQRVGSTTSVMPQPRYEALLLQRAHGRSRWENTPAQDVSLKDLDREEILRTVRLGIDAGRLPESTGRNTGEILDRLSLRKDGQVLNSAGNSPRRPDIRRRSSKKSPARSWCASGQNRDPWPRKSPLKTGPSRDQVGTKSPF